MDDLDVERNEQHDRGDEERREQQTGDDCARTAAGAPRGRSPPVVATTIWANQEPIAMHDRVPEVAADVDVDQASLRLLQAAPCGNSDIGCVIVSVVGVIADFASQSNGPSPITTSPTSRSACARAERPTCTPRPAPVGRRDQRLARSPRRGAPRGRKDDHPVLHERVARR